MINKIKDGINLWTLRGKTNKNMRIVRPADINKIVDEANADISANTSAIAINTSAISSLGGSLNYTEVSLVEVQLRTLFSAPVQILPALPVGQYYTDIKIVAEITQGTVGFDTGDKYLNFYFEPDFVNQMTILTQGFFWDTDKVKVAEAKSSMGFDPFTPTVTSGWQDVTTTGALFLATFTADSTEGNGTMLVKVWYGIGTIGTEL